MIDIKINIYPILQMFIWVYNINIYIYILHNLNINYKWWLLFGGVDGFGGIITRGCGDDTTVFLLLVDDDVRKFINVRFFF